MEVALHECNSIQTVSVAPASVCFAAVSLQSDTRGKGDTWKPLRGRPPLRFDLSCFHPDQFWHFTSSEAFPASASAFFRL